MSRDTLHHEIRWNVKNPLATAIQPEGHGVGRLNRPSTVDWFLAPD